MSSEVVAMATDSSSMTDMTSQPLLAPSADVDPANQPTPGAQPTCENTHTRQGQEKFAPPLTGRASLNLPDPVTGDRSARRLSSG